VATANHAKKNVRGFELRGKLSAMDVIKIIAIGLFSIGEEGSVDTK
jgi:hypothetical protein